MDKVATKSILHDSQQNFEKPECPEGWVNTNIGSIVDLNPPKPAPDALPPNAPVTFVPMPALDAYHGKIVILEERPFDSVRKGYTAFYDNDVIFAKITPCMENGKSAVARNLTNGLGFGSTEFHVLRSNGAVVPDYLFYYIRQESFRKAAEAEMTGSVGQKRVPVNFLKNAPLPLPPLTEQRRIMAKVEELLARVNAAKERLTKVKEILKRFRQSVLAAACSGYLNEDYIGADQPNDEADQLISELWEDRKIGTLKMLGDKKVWKADKSKIKHSKVESEDIGFLQDIPPHWKWVSLSACTDVADGTHDSPKFHATGIPLITSKNLTPAGIDFTNVKLISMEDHIQISKRSSVSDRDILFAMIGTIGIPTIVDGGHPFSIKNVALFRTFGNLHLAKYLRHWLNSPFVQHYFQETSKGSSQSFAPLNVLRRFPVPIPPKSEFAAIVRRVEAIFKLADVIEKRVAMANSQAERLPQAILAKAFRGELVPTEAELARLEGRSYEPASTLLAKIKAQWKDVKPQRKRGRALQRRNNISGLTS